MPVRKRHGYIGAFFVCLLFVCYFLLPGWILRHVTGTSLIRKPLIKGIESTYPVEVHLGSIVYRWGRIELHNLRIKTAEGQPIADIPITRVSPAWGRLLTGRGQGAAAVSRVELVDPVFHLTKEVDGRWNIQRFMGKGQSSTKAWPDLVIRVRNGSLRLPPSIEGITTGDVRSVGVDMRISHLGQLRWQASFQTSQDSQARGWSAGSYDRRTLAGSIDLQMRELSLAMIEDTMKPRFGEAFRDIRSLTGRCSIKTRAEIKGNKLAMGAVSLRLHQAGAHWSKMTVPIRAVDGEVIVDLQSVVVKGIHGQIGEGRIRISGHGDLTGEHTRGDFNLQASRIDLAILRKIHPVIEEYKLSGQGDARLRVSGSLDSPSIRGEIRIRNGAGMEPKRDWKFNKVYALARLDDKGINLRYAQGVWNGMRWNASGTVGLWNNPEWEMAFGFKNLDIQYLGTKLPVEVAPLSGRGWIRGPLRAPLVTWDLKTPKVTWNSLVGRKVNIQGSYNTRSGRLAVSHAGMRMEKARLEGQGEVILKQTEPVFRGIFRAEDLNVNHLPLDVLSKDKIPNVGGSVDLQLNASGRIGVWKTLRLAGQMNAKNGWIEDNAFRDLSADFLYQKGQVHLRSLHLRQDKGEMIASGIWNPTGTLQGDLSVNKLLLRYKTPQGVEATSTVSGNVRLRRNKKEAFSGKGWLDAEDVQYGGKAIGDARLKLSAKGRSLVFDDSLLLLTQGSRMEITGAVTWEQKKPLIDIHLSIPRVTWDTFNAFFPLKKAMAVDAKIQGDLALTGPLFSPVIQGSLFTVQPEVEGRRLDRVEVDFSFENQEVYISKANIRRGKGVITLQGSLTQKRLGLSVEASEFPLQTLNVNLGGIPIQGTMEAKGTIGGELKNPLFEGHIRGNQINLAGLVIERTEGGLIWRNGQLTVDDLAIDRGTQHLKVMGTVALKKEPIMDLRIKMETTRLNELFLVVGLRPEVPMDGLISGQLKLSGAISDPQARLLASLEQGYIYGYRQISGELDLESKGTTVTVHKLRVADPKGSLDASGEYTPGKNLAMKLRVDNLSLGPIASRISDETGLDGRLDLQADLATTTSGLRGKMVGRIREGKYREFFLPLTEFNSHIQDDRFQVDMAQKDLGLTVRGDGPIEPQWLNSLKLPSRKSLQNTGIHLHALAPKVEASLIGKFLPKAKFTEGTLGLDVDVRGTWMKPLFDGEIKVQGVKGKYDPLTEAFEGFNGVLQLTGEKMIIQELSSKYGNGRASASGEVLFDGFIPSKLGIVVQTRRFYYESPSFEGLIDSHFRVAGTLREPLIAGEAVVNRGRISIVSSKKIKRLDPRLDIHVRTGKDNYFRQFGVANLLIDGDLIIKGTMTKPVLDGIVTSNRGVLNLYGNSFRVNSARAEFKPENGFYPYLKAQAKTRTSGVEITLHADGLTGANMNFQFQSVPERSYDEIIALLNWSEMTGKNGISLLQGNMNLVMDSIFGSVLDQFRDVLNVDFLTVEQDRIMGPLRLNMGKSVSDDLYLSYSRILAEDAVDLWSMEYMFTPHLSLLGEHTGEDGTTLQLNFNFSF